MGDPKEVVEDAYTRTRNSGYIRWQATPCIKITGNASGIEWKMSIVNRFIE